MVEEQIARRIESEKEYHKEHYKKAATKLEVSFDLATEEKRRPHNLTWVYYDTILDHFQWNITGKRILVVGCGEGEIALNLAKNGAIIDAFDLSEEAIEICNRRAEFNKIEGINFFVSACETLQLENDHYDAVVGEMILHHIDIPTAMQQFHRFLKVGGLGVFMEWKVYPVLDHVRSIPPLKKLLPAGGVQGYATEYERKLTKDDFNTIRNLFPNMRLDYRYCMRGKIDYFSPTVGTRIEKLDYGLLRMVPFLKYFTDAVVIRFTKEAV